jgi:hypothetical protein
LAGLPEKFKEEQTVFKRIEKNVYKEVFHLSTDPKDFSGQSFDG